MPVTATLPHLLHAFFHDWLVGQRNTSRHTVMSYRDTWRLFLNFMAGQRKCSVAKLAIEQLASAEVLGFLLHCERERGVSVGTRNCRLAALRSFFSYVAGREPQLMAQCAEVLRIPSKRMPQRAVCYLEPKELEAILVQPDRNSLDGQRDHAFLAFLYNTGARIQEALDVCPDAIRFESPAQVRLLGKGRKERVCPLWPETVQLLKALLKRQPRAGSEPVFVNRYGKPLGPSGVRFKLRQYVGAAAKQEPSLAGKRISPHSMRHTTAVHLVASGVDITVIRNLLGHVHLNTTNHYARANMDTKRKALEQVSQRPSKPPRWKRDSALLAWLDSL
jgi:site-specific recombinase XerD